MKILKIIIQISIIYGIYLVGVYLQTTFKIAIPGSIIGMLLLFCLLMTNVIKARWLQDGAQFLLSHLSLLFLPATAGVVGYLSFFKGKGILTFFIVILSTISVMVCSGLIGQFTARMYERGGEKSNNSHIEKIDGS